VSNDNGLERHKVPTFQVAPEERIGVSFFLIVYRTETPSMAQSTKHNSGLLVFSLLVLGIVGLCRYASISIHIDLVTPAAGTWKASIDPLENDEEDDDGCRIDSDRGKIRYEKYSALNANDLLYYESVRKCAADNFVQSLIGRDTTNLTDWDRLLCDHEINHSVLLSVVAKHDRILLIGDSVVRQQYFTLVCMVDPSMTWDDMVKFNTSDLKQDDTQWDYHHADGGITSFLYRVLGMGFDRNETNLYRDAFPKAVLTFSERDAIVIDASRHYDVSTAQYLYEATHFVATAIARAPIYYMEPTPSEFPTSNGFFPEACKDITCNCERLDDARLDGKGTLPIALIEAAIQQNNGSIPSSQYISPVLYDLYPALLTNELDLLNPKLCMPSCVPATWRSDLARMVLLDAAPQVTIVSTFWQLASQDIPTTILPAWDCTHRNFAGVLLMNEQLIRAMQR
jgi:hypothetical protein